MQASVTASGAPLTKRRRPEPEAQATLIILRVRSNSSSPSRGCCRRQCELQSPDACRLTQPYVTIRSPGLHTCIHDKSESRLCCALRAACWTDI